MIAGFLGLSRKFSAVGLWGRIGERPHWASDGWRLRGREKADRTASIVGFAMTAGQTGVNIMPVEMLTYAELDGRLTRPHRRGFDQPTR